MAKTPISYRDAGVDIDAGNRLVDLIKPIAERTRRDGVLAGLGGFGALFQIPQGRYEDPVLVSGTDGVGTKLKLAWQMGRHDTIGIDLVAMCVNDILVAGAEPLFFLDYFATGRLDLDTARAVVEGIGRGCELAGCALIGGETAEMPGLYGDGEYDLAGFCVGVVERGEILDGSRVRAGDRLIGIASSGPHSNGYSLIRKLIEVSGAGLHQPFHGTTLGEALLAPTRIYVKPVRRLMEKMRLHALAHITGGGLLENLPRVLPAHLKADIDGRAWPRPPVFQWIQETATLPDEEMYRTFNCGVGMVVVVNKCDAPRALRHLREAGETAWDIGVVAERGEDEPAVVVHP